MLYINQPTNNVYKTNKTNKQMKNSQRNQFIKKERFLFGK